MNISTTISPGTNDDTSQTFQKLSGELPDERTSLPLPFGQRATILPPRERSLHGNPLLDGISVADASTPAPLVERDKFPMTFQSILFTETKGSILKKHFRYPNSLLI